MSYISSDKEFINFFSQAHGMSVEDLTEIIFRFGLVTFFDDLVKFDNLEEYNKYLKNLKDTMKPFAGNRPKGVIKELKDTIEENKK